MIILRSEILQLRPIALTDASRIFAYRSNPETYKHQYWQPKKIEDVYEFINKRIVKEPNIPNTWLQFAIINTEQNELMGDCGIHFLEEEADQVEIGITLDSKHQGHGYATQALILLFNYIFIDLKKHRIVASVAPENLPSIELLERMRMRKEAHFIESVKIGKKWVDDVVYAILAREWMIP